VFGHLPLPLHEVAGSFFDFTIRRMLVAMGVEPQAVDTAVSPEF